MRQGFLLARGGAFVRAVARSGAPLARFGAQWRPVAREIIGNSTDQTAPNPRLQYKNAEKGEISQ